MDVDATQATATTIGGSDPFVDRVSQELDRLTQEQARLAQQEAEVRRRQSEIQPRIAELQRLLRGYREVMGFSQPSSTPEVAEEDGAAYGSIATLALSVMQKRGGRMRIADLVDELAALRSPKPEYATVYRSLARDPRFARVSPGEFEIGPTDEAILEVIADLQQRMPPPGFVGLKRLVDEHGWHSQVNDLIQRGVLIRYYVSNPNRPDIPTAAVRINTAASAARQSLGSDLLERLDRLPYEGSAAVHPGATDRSES